MQKFWEAWEDNYLADQKVLPFELLIHYKKPLSILQEEVELWKDSMELFSKIPFQL